MCCNVSFSGNSFIVNTSQCPKDISTSFSVKEIWSLSQDWRRQAYAADDARGEGIGVSLISVEMSSGY